MTAGDGERLVEPRKLDGAEDGRNPAGDGAGADAVPAPGGAPPARAGTQGEHRRPADPLLPVRASDLAPYTGLGYLSKLFRVIAVLIALLLIAEVVAGAASDDPDRWQTLLGEVSRLLVVAGVLWGAGDLARLLIDIGHDVRATRILLGRQVAHAAGEGGTSVALAPRDRRGRGAPEAAVDDEPAVAAGASALPASIRGQA